MLKEFIISWEDNDLKISHDSDITIGRNPGSDIYIADKRLSRSHARIFLENGILMIEDLGSSNGTLVNNKLLNGPVQLKSGDRIVAGPLRARIKDAEQESPLKAAPGSPSEDKAEFECPHCGFSITEQIKFCPGCGKSVEEIKQANKCKKCHADLMEGALFCPGCGDSINEIIVLHTKYADFVSRLVAGFFDLCIAVIFLLIFVALPVFFADKYSEDTIDGTMLDKQAVKMVLVFGGMLFAVSIISLFGYVWGVKGKSPGMSFMSIEMTRAGENRSIGFVKAVLRLFFVLFVPGWVGFFMTSKKQMLHDIIAGCRVVSKGKA